MQWNRELLDMLFSSADGIQIAAIPITKINSPDKLVWHFTKDGNYTVRSGYH
ncbi:hypothetical protein CRYUN_Cryun29cG0007900 [Craigia yunnanensis]